MRGLSIILSPAAYLVDLLHFIDAQTVPPGFLNLQTDSRPVAGIFSNLPLTCANTNTALPYIDIVNETLEYFVSHNLSLTGFQGFSTDDNISLGELLAIPQNVTMRRTGSCRTLVLPAAAAVPAAARPAAAAAGEDWRGVAGRDDGASSGRRD